MLVEVMVRDRVKLSLSYDVMIIILCHVADKSWLGIGLS